MFYVYIIKNEKGRHYIGQTNSIENRIIMHNSNSVRSTKNYGPWSYVIFKECQTRSEARKLEEKLKGFKNSAYAIKYLQELPL